MSVRKISGLILFLILGSLSCSREYPVQVRPNQPPKTYLWLFPDSTIAPGVSRQRIHWWGEDPDGYVTGYLFGVAKVSLPVSGIPQPDTIVWSWTTRNDTLIAFPLVTVRDTFTVFVRAVDNTFGGEVDSEYAIIRFTPQPFWDHNRNGVFDEQDQLLLRIMSAVDPRGANQWMPVRNQPPSVRFVDDPNDPTKPMQQPETTFTAATFSWQGTDPDGNYTITGYRIALNDTTNPARFFALSRTDTLITLFVPRARSSSDSGEVAADIYVGNFLRSNANGPIGTIPGLKLDSLNVFFVQAKDVAGEFSPFVRLPDVGRRWFVRKPRSRLLVVADYVDPVDSAAAQQYYHQAFGTIAGGVFSNYDQLNIGRGLTATDKAVFRVGVLVPPFVDPAFVYTLRLFDFVFWYTDQNPSFRVAQKSLAYYTEILRGKVILSTSFRVTNPDPNTGDPRILLPDFAPVDSVGSVDLFTQPRLYPRFGTEQILGGYRLLPESSGSSGPYPIIAFDSTSYVHIVNVRPIYMRADGRYIYRLEDYRDANPVRYTYTITLSNLRAVSVTAGGSSYSVGDVGTIAVSMDQGTTWTLQPSGTDRTLRAVHFPSNTRGWTVGDAGTILMNSGGSSWANQSRVTSQDFYCVRFLDDNTGYAVGTKGILIKTTNGGSSWASLASRTPRTLRGVAVMDANTAVVVGDSALVIKTTNGGTDWVQKPVSAGLFRRLHAVSFTSNANGYAVGASGMYARSTDAGENWTSQTVSVFGGTELRSISFANGNEGMVAGAGGSVFKTNDGGTTWTKALQSGGQNLTTQHVNGVATLGSLGVIVGTGGIILRSTDSGVSWTFQPRGSLYVGVVDGNRRFVFLGLPLHLLRSQAGIGAFLEHVFVSEFGL